MFTEIKYHKIANKKYPNGHAKDDEFIYGFIDELIARIKFYIKVGYSYGDDMKEVSKIIERYLIKWMLFLKELERFGLIAEKYESTQVNNYLVEPCGN